LGLINTIKIKEIDLLVKIRGRFIFYFLFGALGDCLSCLCSRASCDKI